MSTSVRSVGTLAVLAAVAGLLVPPAHAQAPETYPLSAEALSRGKALLARLQAGGTIHIMAFGDSLTAGWGTDGRHVFHKMFVQALAPRFPKAKLRLTVLGYPGQTTADALRHAPRRVIPAKPDLLLVQFGGNDMGHGRSVSAFGADLAKLLNMLEKQTTAVIIPCLPPIIAKNTHNPWDEMARKVAGEAGLSAADLDWCMRQGDHDYRSAFPYGSHPGSFTHVIWAKEVLRAFDRVTGTTPTLACSLEGPPHVSNAGDYSVKARLRNLSPGELSCTAVIESGGQARTHVVKLPARGEATVEEAFPLPKGRPLDRAFHIPVHLWASVPGYSNFDVRWEEIAPAVSLTGPAITLGYSSLVFGRQLWLGPQDLSGTCTIKATGKALVWQIAVTDNNLSVANLFDPAQGDSVELYLDLRDEADQGKPIYSADVLALQIIPPQPGRPLRWKAMQPLPDDLRTISVKGQDTKSGYQIEVAVPLAAIRSRRGDKWQGLGFDVGINDADFGGGRKLQMMWCGSPDNYLDPSYLGGLYDGALPSGATRRLLR